MTPDSPTTKLRRAIPVAAMSLLLLTAGMCRQAEEPAAEAGAAADAAALAAEAAAEREALAAERAAAEAAERERLAAIAAAEQELAEREARLAAEEDRRRREQALAAERRRLEADRAAAAERERELAARERELREREEQLAWREEELGGDSAEPAAAPPPEGSGGYEGNFEEPWREDPPAGAEPAGPRAEAPPAPATKKASVLPGELLEVQFTSALSSATSRVGDTFSTRLVHDVYDAQGTLVIPAGAQVRGRVTEAEPYRRGGGPATLGVEFTQVVVPPDQTVGIQASFVELGADKRKNRKKVIAGAVAGAVLGHILGGDGSKNVLIGAAVGAAAGGAMVARAKDKDAEIPAGQVVTLELYEVVTVDIRYGAPARR